MSKIRVECGFDDDWACAVGWRLLSFSAGSSQYIVLLVVVGSADNAIFVVAVARFRVVVHGRDPLFGPITGLPLTTTMSGVTNNDLGNRRSIIRATKQQQETLKAAYYQYGEPFSEDILNMLREQTSLYAVLGRCMRV